MNTDSSNPDAHGVTRPTFASIRVLLLSVFIRVHPWLKKSAALGVLSVSALKVFPFDWPPNPTRLAPQPPILDCGGKRSATPLWKVTGRAESGVAAAL